MLRNEINSQVQMSYFFRLSSVKSKPSLLFLFYLNWFYGNRQQAGAWNAFAGAVEVNDFAQGAL